VFFHVHSDLTILDCHFWVIFCVQLTLHVYLLVFFYVDWDLTSPFRTLYLLVIFSVYSHLIILDCILLVNLCVYSYLIFLDCFSLGVLLCRLGPHLIILNFLPPGDLLCPAWIRNTVDYESEGRRLVGHVIATYDNVFVVTQCARRCQLLSACATYNFLSAQHRCEINSVSHVTNPSDVSSSDESQYYKRDAFTIDPVTLVTYLLLTFNYFFYTNCSNLYRNK